MASIIVAGSTGAIGRTVVQHAAKNAKISRVVALTRSANTSPENFHTLFGIHHRDGDSDAAAGGAGAALPPNEVVLSAEEVAKIHPVTFDWEQFLAAWKLLQQSHRGTPPAAAAANATQGAGLDGNSSDSLSEQVAQWKGVFGGHHHAAMCLGTTRADAGGAEQFIRCDYEYVVAFAEAVLLFSAPAGFTFPGGSNSGDAKAHKSDDPAVVNAPYLYTIEGKTTPLKPPSKANRGGAAEAVTLETTLPRLVLVNDRTHTSGTLRTWVQVSAQNASRGSFLLYPKTKGAADAAVAERVLLHNELLLNGATPSGDHKKKAAAAAEKGGDDGEGEGKAEAAEDATTPVSYAVIMPGLLERYGKTRGTEKWGKFILSAIGVEKCGQCAVADCVFDGRRRAGEADDEDVFQTVAAVGGKKGKCNRHAFDFHGGDYFTTAAAAQQVAHNGNKMLYYWQGNKEITQQAERLQKTY